MKKAGIFIIAIGLILTISYRYNFFSPQEKVVDIGSLKNYCKQKPHHLSWSNFQLVLPLCGVGELLYLCLSRNS